MSCKNKNIIPDKMFFLGLTIIILEISFPVKLEKYSPKHGTALPVSPAF